MSEDVMAKLAERKLKVESEFAKVTELKQQVLGQQAELGKKLSQCDQRLTQLQGAHAELVELSGEKPVPVEGPVEPKKKK